MGRREGGEVAINTAVLTFWVIAIGIPQSVNNPFFPVPSPLPLASSEPKEGGEEGRGCKKVLKSESKRREEQPLRLKARNSRLYSSVSSRSHQAAEARMEDEVQSRLPHSEHTFPSVHVSGRPPMNGDFFIASPLAMNGTMLQG